MFYRKNLNGGLGGDYKNHALGFAKKIFQGPMALFQQPYYIFRFLEPGGIM